MVILFEENSAVICTHTYLWNSVFFRKSEDVRKKEDYYENSKLITYVGMALEREKVILFIKNSINNSCTYILWEFPTYFRKFKWYPIIYFSSVSGMIKK